MNILGRSIHATCEAFLAAALGEMATPVFEPASKGPNRSGGTYWGASQMIDGVPHIWVDTGLDDAAFAHTCAHEVGHMLQRTRKFTEIFARARTNTDWQRVVSTFSEALECPAVDELLGPYGTDKSHSLEMRRETVRAQARIALTGAPALANHNFVRRILVLVRAGLEQPEEFWDHVRQEYAEITPAIPVFADEVVSRVRDTGLATKDQRWDSMLYVQSRLSLIGMVVLIDPATGRRR